MQFRNAWGLIASIWIVVSLACNLPARKAGEPELSIEALRQTLAAQGSPGQGSPESPSTLPAGSLTPFPGAPHPNQPVRTPLPDEAIFNYYAQPGDTLETLARRFAVAPEEILSDQPIPGRGLITNHQLLRIPNRLGVGVNPNAVLPDSEIVHSPTALDFNLEAYVAAAGGFLKTYSENFNGEILTGITALQRVASESSINPRLLLALLEFQAGWVMGQPVNQTARTYPIGFHVSGQTGLYRELVMTATHLNSAYYGWRTGTTTQVTFQDGKTARLSPGLNAGSAAIQVLLAKFYTQAAWEEAIYASQGFLALYENMFGDPWQRAAALGALLPDGLTQPPLELPFQPGERWSLTAGPHPAWKTGSPRGALDFAPVTGEPACSVSRWWTLASAPGLVVRSQRNVVALDLDGDGYEQTGWVLIYMHLADSERVAAGTWVQQDDRLGHPSCEGGTSTGTHVHVARKYNGEWLAADGPLPFVLSGWTAYAYDKNYLGELRKGDQVVVASPVGPQTSIIKR